MPSIQDDEPKLHVDMDAPRRPYYSRYYVDHAVDAAIKAERNRCEDIVCGLWPDQAAIRAAILNPKE